VRVIPQRSLSNELMTEGIVMRHRGEATGMTMNSSHWDVFKPIVTKGRVVDVRSFAWDPDPSLREMNNRIGKPGTALPEVPRRTPGSSNPLRTSACLPMLLVITYLTNPCFLCIKNT